MERIVIKHISHLLHAILPRATKAKHNILELFKWLNPELVLTVGGQKLVFHPQLTRLNKAENISEILIKLDEAARLTKKRVVVVMDEFQQLSYIQNHAIGASIRHAMQYSQNISYIFSGSNRHMLVNIFNSKNRLFYNSCEIVKLDRISAKDYEWFIQQAAEKQWNKRLSQNVLEEIFKLFELHPSYVNRICGHFWIMSKVPTQESIELYWHNFVESK